MPAGSPHAETTPGMDERRMTTLTDYSPGQPKREEGTIDFTRFPSPCYVVDERLVRRNLERIDTVQQRTGCKVLLALKGFSM